MEVRGYVATPLEKKTAKSGKEYYTFRLAENHGKEENRTTTWYDVSAFISELDADLISKGSFVRVIGRLSAEAYLSKSGEPAAALRILSSSIEPVERRRTMPAAEAGTSRATAAAAAVDVDDDIPF